MILGKQLPTRANEIHERRLFHLIKHYFKGRLPSEAEVSALFQITHTSSRTLMRNVRTKFKYELEEAVKFTARETLRNASMKQGDYRVVIQSENILEELQQIVSTNAPELEQIKRLRGSAGIYVVPEDTFELLASHFDIQLSELVVASSKG